MNKIDVALLGVPIDLGTFGLGVDIGPQALRHAHIKEKLQKAGMRISDLGNIACKSRDEAKIGSLNLKYLNEVVRVNTEVANIVEKEVSEGKKMITIGGDHSLSIGTISGASKALKGDVGVIYLDAHGDFNTPEITISGNIHGMGLATLCGYGAKELTQLHIPSIKLKSKNTLLVGNTDLDEEEEKLIKKSQIITFDLRDFLARNLGELFKLILDLQKSVGNVWVSLDLDVIDGVYAPGVGIPNRSGFTYREIVELVRYIGKKCNVMGVDLVEYNPTRDIGGKTAELAIEIIAKLLGSDYNLYTEYMDTQKIG